MENLMIEIMDLADEKFKTNDDHCSDNIHLGVHNAESEWAVWLERGTRKHVRKFGNEQMVDGDIMELESWLCGKGDSFEEALQDLLLELQDTKMKRGSGNRLVPVIEE